jgi:hypothetical protein
MHAWRSRVQVGDAPLTKAQYDSMRTGAAGAATGGAAQIPFAGSAVGVFFNQQRGYQTLWFLILFVLKHMLRSWTWRRPDPVQRLGRRRLV